MILNKDNFSTNIIFINKDNSIYRSDITHMLSGFSDSNKSSILHTDSSDLSTEKLKYKLLFNNIKIPDNVEIILFQVSLIIDNMYYNPYLFLPLANKIGKYKCDGNGRYLSYEIINNKFEYIWFYLNRKHIDNIINTFEKEKTLISAIEYIKEYF